MGFLILTFIVFSLVVGVQHKAKHHDADLPTCVMDGAKAFFGDLKSALSTVLKKKPKPEPAQEGEDAESAQKPEVKEKSEEK
ncbi:hypothetical protein [Photobacterium galatheae]|uniref:Uncharacterized protein n=1 Tax=Photobacterium galatheae TaxID=1654360 RepID=A0A066RK71_9GAMM|nr:hypothetical protein [Photobacterium galatheae]KDM90840.1 hypothetical protein EA58_13855 [Photobacterium galatheae]MCM0149192.1 hypothetical protein [Photobacterium galatheae]